MEAKHKRTIWLIVLGLYVSMALGAYFGDIRGLLFFLTVPWSLAVAALGFMLIHASTVDPGTYLLVGGVLNVLLILILIFRSYP